MADKEVVLGDFKLKKKLGQGGMGAVYLGHQVSLDRACAVKVLSKELAAKPGFVERFVREARAMARIDHPNVVSCYAVGEDKGHHYVAMELMDGKSLQDWMSVKSPFEISDAVLIGIVCGEALQHAHSLNMIHRDIKPDNILCTSKGNIKVADMGLAKAIDDEDMSLTQSGTGLGTPHYMPPEQARNAKHVDQRCDIYALGCTLYHFLTGKPPFEGESVVELITNKEKGKFQPAKRLNPNVPEKLDLMIAKAMAQKPEHRYQSCAELVSDLESLGVAGEALSFIDEDVRIPVRRNSASTATMAGGAKTMAPQPVGMRTATIPSASKPDTKSSRSSGSNWYVKHEGSSGMKVGKMTAPQILQAIKSDKFNAKTQASPNAKGPFLPLVQIPVFEDETKKMLARQQAQSRDNNLAAEYEKLAKQYERRKIWRYLGKLVDGTMGMVGLLIWLAIIAAIGAGLYFGLPIIFDMIAQNVGLAK